MTQKLTNSRAIKSSFLQKILFFTKKPNLLNFYDNSGIPRIGTKASIHTNFSNMTQ